MGAGYDDIMWEKRGSWSGLGEMCVKVRCLSANYIGYVISLRKFLNEIGNLALYSNRVIATPAQTNTTKQNKLFLLYVS